MFYKQLYDITNYKIWVNCKYLDYDEVEDNVNIVQSTPTKILQEQDTPEVNIYSYRTISLYILYISLISISVFIYIFMYLIEYL